MSTARVSRAIVRGLTLGALAVTVTSCQRAPVPNGLPPRADAGTVRTLRGIVAVTGNDPRTQVELQVPALGAVRVIGALDAELRAAQGLEVDITGRVAPSDGQFDQPAAQRTIDATRFDVRASDGVAAMDGVLTARGAEIVLKLADGGTRPLPFLPTGLRSLIGARVFFVGPLDAAPVGYGVLRPPPAPTRH